MSLQEITCSSWEDLYRILEISPAVDPKQIEERYHQLKMALSQEQPHDLRGQLARQCKFIALEDAYLFFQKNAKKI